MPTFKPSPAGPSRAPFLIILPIFISAAVVLLLAVSAAPAAASVESRLDTTRGKLDQANEKRGVLTDQIAGMSSRIKSYETQVVALRAEEQAAAARLAAKQAELDQAQAEVERAYAQLKVLAARLERARKVLGNRLVAIYQGGPSNVSELVLTSRSYGDLIQRSTYLEQIQNRDQAIAGRVRELRDAQKRLVRKLRDAKERIESARDEIAAEKANLTTARAAVESQQNRLLSVRSARRSALASIDSQVENLEEIESNLQARIQAQIGAASGASTLPAGPMSAPSAAGLIWPVSGTLTSGFGGRNSPGGIGSTNHEGLDIAVPEGTPIRAAKGGTVIMASYNGGYGNYTCIDHGSGLSTCYAHQSSFAVSAGQRVSQGQVIGYSGNTGASTGPHLHFEVRINGVAQDPTAYL
ncbi:MAG: peptidoglycan DD-metalloendopeptidase family protein [Solirubrobacterales bacterium]|nr:peptidoglycan DD-metalloendopeptidase family protein [Solirubrobacterales bacterium]